MKTNQFNEEFFSIPLYVDSRVLIPRNDTEVIVYEVLKEIKNLEKFNYIDIGTGSAAIPIAVFKNAKIKPQKSIAIDISLDALEVAKINISRHNLDNNIELIHSDLLERILNTSPLTPLLSVEGNYEGVLIITANLPYIKNGDFENMDKDVLDNEPHLALFGGEETGFELYEKLINQINQFKQKNSISKVILFIEIGFDQYEYSKSYLEKLGLSFQYYKDLNSIWRCIRIYL